MPRVPPSRTNDHQPDRRDQAAMYQIGLQAHDPVRQRWPGGDFRPPLGSDRDRGRRVRTILERIGIAKPKGST